VRRAAWLVAAALGCEAQNSGEQGEVLAGEHVELHVEAGLKPCGDVVAHMDAFTAAVADALAVDIDGLVFEYHWWSRDGLAGTPCGDGVLGCATPSGIHAQVAPLDHELVHSVSFEIGYPPSFFVEGLAVAFQTHSLLRSDPLAPPGDASVLAAIESTTTDSLGGMHYALAGAFTRFLIDRHGMPAYRELYASLGYRHSLAQIEATFAAVLGEPLADAIAAFDAERRGCPAGVSTFALRECGAPALAWDDRELEVRRSLLCGEPDVVGPFFDGTARVSAAFEVVEAGGFVATFASEWPSSVVALTSCGGCDGDWVAAVLRAEDGPREVFLPAGRYALRFAGATGQETGLALRLRRVEDDGLADL
jgi:hypothetical protein